MTNPAVSWLGFPPECQIRRLMQTSRLAAALLALALAGCAGLSEILQYKDVSPVRMTDAGHVWRIFDKPLEHRLMITPTIGRAAGLGLGRGLTGVDAIPKPEFESAATAWLASTGRNCTLIDGYVLAEPQWEFKYRCGD